MGAVPGAQCQGHCGAPVGGRTREDKGAVVGLLRKIIGWVLLAAAAFSLMVTIMLLADAAIGAMVVELIVTAAVGYAGLRLIRAGHAAAPQVTPRSTVAPVVPATPSAPALHQGQVTTAGRDLTLVTLAGNPRLPAEARDCLERLDWRCSQVEAALTPPDRIGAGAAYQVEQIRSEYAPQAVNGYLSLPPETADTEPITEGKTGKDLLLEQLDLLTGAADDLRRHLSGGGADQVVADYTFLREKFAPRDHDLDL